MNNRYNELNEKVQERIIERSTQDLEAIRLYTCQNSDRQYNLFFQKPLTREEIDKKVRETMTERTKQDLEAMKRYNLKT